MISFSFYRFLYLLSLSSLWKRLRKRGKRMAAFQILQRVLLALSALWGLCYLYQTAYLFLPLLKKRENPEPGGPARRLHYAILIAARNEEAVLPYLLDSIRAQDYPAERIKVYVAADNCADRTADIARAWGAWVWERHDLTHIGKGYALHFLLEQMRAGGELDRSDAFLVFDADNLLAPDYIAQIDKTFSQGFAAVCGYRNSKNFMENWVSAGSGLWYIHDSAHLNASRMLLGVTCAVTGTGFGFTRELLERCGGWRFFTLVEDVEFDAWCAVHGVRIGYCPAAVVYDEQPVAFSQSWRQRVRWIQGGAQVSLKYWGRFMGGLFGRSRLPTRYACFENLTLSPFGYAVGALSGFAASVAAFLTSGRISALLTPLAGAWAAMFFVGALTTAAEWRRIPGTPWQKLKSCLTFPLFMLTYIPAAVWACAVKAQWKPVYHTAKVDIRDIAITKL